MRAIEHMQQAIRQSQAERQRKLAAPEVPAKANGARDTEVNIGADQNSSADTEGDASNLL
jgi:hypothetical protein